MMMMMLMWFIYYILGNFKEIMKRMQKASGEGCGRFVLVPYYYFITITYVDFFAQCSILTCNVM